MVVDDRADEEKAAGGGGPVGDDHPVVQAFARAPVVPGRASDEERAAVAAAASGPWIPHEEVMARLNALQGCLDAIGASDALIPPPPIEVAYDSDAKRIEVHIPMGFDPKTR